MRVGPDLRDWHVGYKKISVLVFVTLPENRRDSVFARLKETNHVFAQEIIRDRSAIKKTD
ncbi:hypothetical protein DPMN_050607 [Dreissena polymorpha]|uniref:Uncharacterized protein n=1 Tax=Dreissena polymorpha TaxID=45954 RepID=A0A9D4HLG7_DREPO|nr:hypothetical protein DPMN_050607 [Dreissena polymorpha]